MEVASPAATRATAAPGCTQEDFPALEIQLVSRPAPGGFPSGEGHVSIEIAGRTPSPGVYPLSPLRRERGSGGRLARAALHRGDGEVTWLRGTVRIDSVSEGFVSGAYQFDSEAGQRSGTFRAPITSGAATCG